MSKEVLAREFEFISLKQDGHVLEVTLNRPASYNALHSAAHFELDEIFNAFEADQRLPRRRHSLCPKAETKMGEWLIDD